MFVSSLLESGRIYTRIDLMEILRSADATIMTGIFRPKGFDSVCLFATEQKSADRTQYVDELQGNHFYFEGQTKGRKDRMLSDHERLGLEILVFHRKVKNEFPGSGFRYEGRFRYVSHSGGFPARFVFTRVADDSAGLPRGESASAGGS